MVFRKDDQQPVYRSEGAVPQEPIPEKTPEGHPRTPTDLERQQELQYLHFAKNGVKSVKNSCKQKQLLHRDSRGNSLELVKEKRNALKSSASVGTEPTEENDEILNLLLKNIEGPQRDGEVPKESVEELMDYLNEEEVADPFEGLVYLLPDKPGDLERLLEEAMQDLITPQKQTGKMGKHHVSLEKSIPVDIDDMESLIKELENAKDKAKEERVSLLRKSGLDDKEMARCLYYLLQMRETPFSREEKRDIEKTEFLKGYVEDWDSSIDDENKP